MEQSSILVGPGLAIMSACHIRAPDKEHTYYLAPAFSVLCVSDHARVRLRCPSSCVVGLACPAFSFVHVQTYEPMDFYDGWDLTHEGIPHGVYQQKPVVFSTCSVVQCEILTSWIGDVTL